MHPLQVLVLHAIHASLQVASMKDKWFVFVESRLALLYTKGTSYVIKDLVSLCNNKIFILQAVGHTMDPILYW